MRSNGPLANKEVAIGGHGWPWVARSSGVAKSGRLVRRMSHRVDPAAIAEEARTVRLDVVLGPPRRSVPVGDSSTPESRTLSLFGRWWSSAFRLTTPIFVARGPALLLQEETEQSDSRTDRGRAIDTRAQSELVSSIVPRGTSFCAGLRFCRSDSVRRSD